MKISALNIGQAVEDGVWVDILMPADRPDLDLLEGDPSGLRVRVRSADSRQFREAMDKLTRAAVKRKAQSMTFEDSERSQVDILLAVTADWSGFEDDDGKAMPFTEANGRRIYGDPGYKWLTDQVTRAADDRRRFFGS